MVIICLSMIHLPLDITAHSMLYWSKVIIKFHGWINCQLIDLDYCDQCHPYANVETLTKIDCSQDNAINFEWQQHNDLNDWRKQMRAIFVCNFWRCCVIMLNRMQSCNTSFAWNPIPKSKNNNKKKNEMSPSR